MGTDRAVILVDPTGALGIGDHARGAVLPAGAAGMGAELAQGGLIHPGVTRVINGGDARESLGNAAGRGLRVVHAHLEALEVIGVYQLHITRGRDRDNHGSISPEGAIDKDQRVYRLIDNSFQNLAYDEGMRAIGHDCSDLAQNNGLCANKGWAAISG